MDCILLGIGATMPLYKRPLTAAAVRINGRLYFFDGGEGVQIACKSVHLGFRAISVMTVSHLHADHCLGLPGMLMMRARSEDPGPLTIIGPPGIARFIKDVKRDLAFYTNYEIEFVEWSKDHPPGGVAFEDDQIKIRWALMKHTVPCLGYVLEEHDRPGKFNVAKAIAAGIPQGPLWGKLQHGETITLPDGAIVAPEQVMGEKRPGRRIAYITDTFLNKNLYKLLDGADLALIEGMFHSSDAELAQKRLHLTAKEAGRLCSRANVGRAVLVHVSPRYENAKLLELEAEARAQFPQTEMGRFGAVYSVPISDEKARA